ncbi:MAG: substrate-binding domain-containing protein [Promethearchaeota archaeon]|jgi:tungstate transport system substrate-binding protein
MSARRNLKQVLGEHKTAVILALVIIAGGSISTFFIYDFTNAQNPDQITLATTTSTYDSGLLEYLLPKFTEETGIKIRVLSVGTGQAIAYGQSGDADAILVHSRPREDAFINDTGDQIPYGIHRACIMYNDFIIVGDLSNPADLQPNDNISTAMRKLKDAIDTGNVTFYSRGDSSGTHSKELFLWSLIGIIPESYWFAEPNKYAETGSGMSTTLLLTYEDASDAHKGYTLVDRGTWLSFNDTYTSLKILAESTNDEDILLNPYGFIPVNPDRHPHVKYDAVLRFGGFLTSEYGQSLISAYKKNDEVLFHSSYSFCNETHSCLTTDEEVAFWTQHQSEFQGLII